MYKFKIEDWSQIISETPPFFLFERLINQVIYAIIPYHRLS